MQTARDATALQHDDEKQTLMQRLFRRGVKLDAINQDDEE
jgi:hypothetical protein